MWSIRKCALALCFLGAAHVVSTASLQNGDHKAKKLEPVEHQSESVGSTLRRARSAAEWIGAIAGNTAGTSHNVPTGSTINSIWQPPPIKIAGADGTTTALQLVLLVMSPPAAPSQCQSNAAPSSNINTVSQSVDQATVTPTSAPAFAPSSEFYYDDEPASTAATTTKNPRRPQRPTTSRSGLPQPTFAPVSEPEPVLPPNPPSVERRTRSAPTFPPVEDSQQLLQQFRAQIARNPTLPPVVTQPLVTILDDMLAPDNENSAASASTSSASSPQSSSFQGTNGNLFDRSEVERCIGTCKRKLRSRFAAGGGGGVSDPVIAEESVSSPPLPRFDRSMMLRAILTVPGADYVEPYTVWWDAASGASRIDYHDNTASTYRMTRLDGLVQSVHVRVDRTGESDVRRCVTLTPRRVSLAERALPVLPDLSGFTFAGYVEMPTTGDNLPVRVERWRYTASGKGIIRSEVLTYRHELLVARAPDNFTTTPLRYAVAVDSSALGENSDSYAHRFIRVQTQHHDPAMFQLHIGDACETIEKTDQIDIVEPLREFTMLQRGPKHGKEFQQYKKLFVRNYADDLEETVRMNVLMQTSRFVSSGNRKGASFELETNFLSDRLEVERRRLLGSAEISSNRSQPFPHSAEELNGLRGRLPRTFDWRKLGGVTSVRYQDTCESCWAFSVVGAVEGALFVNTGRLVPLSEQSLVDCGHPYGTHGCKPTWPNFAYDYVEDQGLPALDEYPEYKAKVQQCQASQVPAVTRISGHVNVTSKNIVALKVAIRRHGPTVVLLDAFTTPSFAAHKSGFYHDAKCKKNVSNHAMLAVGWTVHRGETYFILKNWWSEKWGEGGYINVRASTNTCGLLRLPSYPVLRNSDVLRIPASAATAVTPPSS